jgi:CheY-like chemotaxis protein
MPAYQQEHGDRTVSSQQQPQTTPARETAAPACDSKKSAEAIALPQFCFRILVVDDEPSICETVEQILESDGYEVLTAKDGVDGLNALSKSLPDLIISDLNMPRMSGFEFLAVVRERFPHIATIAMSGGHSSGESSIELLADAFFQKGHYTFEELSQQVEALLAASPLRSEKRKSDVAPLFVPRDSAGYLIITCPKCLRPNKLEAMSLNGGLHQTTCQTCGMPVRFEINHEIEPLTGRKYA